MFYRTYTFYFVDIILGTSIQDRKFRTVHLNEAVVYAQRVERSHAVLYGTYLNPVFGKHGAACRFGHVIGNSVNDRLTFQVGTLNLISVIVRSRVESNGQIKSSVKTFPTE